MAKGNFIEYVISDNPNKYPNESEQDGYYYRKVTKFETEEQTITAGTTPIEVIPSQGKLISKVNINPTPTEEKTVTPTTEDLVVAPVEGKLLSQVTVQGDANFLEENIAEGVTMWGKTGTHQGGGVPGQYVWSKQYAGSNYTYESKSSIYTLTNDSIESVDIEYSTTAPVYNIETKKWDMADSTIITLINTDNFIPNIIAQKVYIRMNSEPNIWYLYQEKDPGCPFSVGSASSNNTYTKTFTCSTKYTAAIDSSYIEYVTGETEADYPDGGWVDGEYYERFVNKIAFNIYNGRSVVSGLFMYYAEKGMMWKDFINSKYNNGVFTCGTAYVCYRGFEVTDVVPTDIIKSGIIYRYTESGGSN